MHFDHIPSLLTGLAGSAIVAFCVAVAVDTIVAVVAAIKAKQFDWNKLADFLESQYGTKKALALAGTVVTAALAAYVGQQDVKKAALAVATAGATAMTAGVVADAVAKIKALAGIA